MFQQHSILIINVFEKEKLTPSERIETGTPDNNIEVEGINFSLSKTSINYL